MTDKKPTKPTYSAEFVRDISLKVYRAELDRSCPGDADSMVKKDGDGGVKQRNRAVFMDSTTRQYLKALEIPIQ